MKDIIKMLRLILSDKLLYWAFRAAPADDRQAEYLGRVITENVAASVRAPDTAPADRSTFDILRAIAAFQIEFQWDKIDPPALMVMPNAEAGERLAAHLREQSPLVSATYAMASIGRDVSFPLVSGTWRELMVFGVIIRWPINGAAHMTVRNWLKNWEAEG